MTQTNYLGSMDGRVVSHSTVNFDLLHPGLWVCTSAKTRAYHVVNMTKGLGLNPIDLFALLSAKLYLFGVVVVAQLVERLLPIPEVRSPNPAIGNIFCWTFTVNCFEKMRIKKKRPGMAHIFLKNYTYLNFFPLEQLLCRKKRMRNNLRRRKGLKMMLKNRLLQTFLPINNQEMMRHLKHDFVHHEMNNDDNNIKNNNIKNNNNNQNDTVLLLFLSAQLWKCLMVKDVRT